MVEIDEDDADETRTLAVARRFSEFVELDAQLRQGLSVELADERTHELDVLRVALVESAVALGHALVRRRVHLVGALADGREAEGEEGALDGLGKKGQVR